MNGDKLCALEQIFGLFGLAESYPEIGYDNNDGSDADDASNRLNKYV